MILKKTKRKVKKESANLASSKQTKLRRTVSVLSLIASLTILAAGVMGSGSPSLALENTRTMTVRRDVSVPEFARIMPDNEQVAYEIPSPAPTAKDFETAFSKNFEPQDRILYVNNKLYSKRVMLDGDVLYVGISDFVYVLDNSAEIAEKQSSVTVNTEGVSLSVSKGASYIVANGRYLWCHGGVKNENGTLMIPLELLCTVFGASRSSDEERISVTSGGTPIESGDTFYNKDTVYWLSRIISAESRGEPFRGKLAVGNVVLNRVRSSSFPSTVYGVIFDRKNGVQFTPVEIGTVYNTPDADSVIAAKLCLEGVTVSNKILYFLNPDTAGNFWVTENRKYVTTIGNHKFYS